MRQITILIAIVLIFACKKSNDILPSENKVENVNSTYFLKSLNPYETGYHLLASSRFQYQSGRVIKRSGSYLPIPGGTNWNYTELIFDTITYQGKQVNIQAVDRTFSSQATLPKWQFEIENGLPQRRITFLQISGNNTPIDTTFYYYSNGKVQKVEKHHSVQGSSYVFTKNFEFENNNLKRVLATYLKKPNTTLYTTEETFDGFDTKSNPLTHLWFWDDLYYRSLSANNFSKYTRKNYNENGQLTDSIRQIWNLQYDSKGNIIY